VCVCVVCVCGVCVVFVCVSPNVTNNCYFELQVHLNEQINSTEALSRDLKRSETINSNLNTTLAGLTKKLEALNQTLPLLCGRIKDVSTYIYIIQTLSKPLMMYV